MEKTHQITPRDALAVADNAVTAIDFQWAAGLIKEYFDSNPRAKLGEWECCDLIAIAYNAGKRQGTHQERQKKADRIGREV